MGRPEGSPAFDRDNRTFRRSVSGAAEELVHFEDDFHGASINLKESGAGGTWDFVSVGQAVVNSLDHTAEDASGVARLLFDASVEDQDAVLYMGDIRQFDVTKNVLIEMRLAVHVIPTLTTEIVWGMAGDHNLAYDSITEQAFFNLDGSAALRVQIDDTTNDKDEDASTTLVADAWHVYTIDFREISDVMFFVDGVQVATGTTYDMSNLTAAEAYMQPYLGLAKTGDAGLGSIDIDYVKIWCNRS